MSLLRKTSSREGSSAPLPMSPEELLQILRKADWETQVKRLSPEYQAEALEAYARLPFEQLHTLQDYTSVMSFMSKLGWAQTVSYWGQANVPRKRAEQLWE